MGEISSNAQGNGIGAEFVNGRDRAIALYHTECRRSVCNNDIDVPPLQLLNERGNLFQKVICEKRIELKRAGLGIAVSGESVAKGIKKICCRARVEAAYKADMRWAHSFCCERPSCCNSTAKRDEFPPSHRFPQPGYKPTPAAY